MVRKKVVHGPRQENEHKKRTYDQSSGLKLHALDKGAALSPSHQIQTAFY